MINIEVYKNIDELVNAIAEVICDVSKEAIKARGQFSFVLSGGNSPRKLYKVLASEAYKNKIEWNKTYFSFGDERFVPENDPQRNSLMANETLFTPLKIKETHIFKVDTTGTPEEAAQRYIETIKAHFDKKSIAFDFILLGLGNNAHTASLFPNTFVLKESEMTIKSVFVKELDRYRITMTAPLINQSKYIAFLVFGKDKADAVYNVLEAKSSSSNLYPARIIKSDENKVLWFFDTTAVARLKKINET